MAAKTSNHPAASNKNPVSFMKNLVYYNSATLRVGDAARRLSKRSASNRKPALAGHTGVCVNKVMPDVAEQPFHSIESAHEFMVLLENVIADAQGELQNMLNDANNASDERRSEALRLALFKIAQLDVHTRKSRRILNDLGLIRSLLVRGQ